MSKLEDLLDDALDDIVTADYTKFSQVTEEEEEKYINDLTAQFDKTFADFLAQQPDLQTRDVREEDEEEEEEEEEDEESLREKVRLTAEVLMKGKARDDFVPPPGGEAGGVPSSPGEGAAGAGAGPSTEDMIPMLEGLLGKLLSKEILQEPLEELLKFYPAWLEENSAHPQIDSYRRQKDIVSEICSIFSQPGSDARSSDVFRLLNEMQETGPPPQQIVDQMSQEMPPNLSAPPPMPGADQCSVM